MWRAGANENTTIRFTDPVTIEGQALDKGTYGLHMIIDRLNRGECSVGELTELIGNDVSTVSKHLSLLRANGIVDDRRQGTTVFYRLLTPCACNFFACATQVLKERSK